MLPLPATPTNLLALTDWVELFALLSPDGNSSLGDLERVLKRGSVFSEYRDELEEKLADIQKELAARAMAAGPSYPFLLEGNVVVKRNGWERSTYAFCLLLSYGEWEQPEGESTFPARAFETICTIASAKFISGIGDGGLGSAVRFGAPRATPIPKSFREAIDVLCRGLGEGQGWRHGKKLPPGARPQDGGLDVVAWRNFRDGKPGKLLLFGNCATGKNWEGKTRDLNEDFFCQEWLVEIPPTRIVRAFFVPHRVDPHRWNSITRDAGIVFERCRISGLVAEVPADARIHGDIARWMKIALKRVATEPTSSSRQRVGARATRQGSRRRVPCARHYSSKGGLRRAVSGAKKR